MKEKYNKNVGMIYKHTNLLNGKSYIGQTKANNPNERWQNGKKYKKSILFYKAIQKYGWDNFSHEIIESNIPIDDLDDREIYWIEYYHTYIGDEQCNGYNLTKGGNTRNGYIMCDETKDKISKSLLGHDVSDNVRKNISEYNKAHKGIKPKNFNDALAKAHLANSIKIVEIETHKVFNSKTECASYYNKSTSWVRNRIKGNPHCIIERFVEETTYDRLSLR